jgi:hypothetical protein
MTRPLRNILELLTSQTSKQNTNKKIFFVPETLKSSADYAGKNIQG